MAKSSAPIIPDVIPPAPVPAERWQFDPRTWEAVPRAMLAIAIDRTLTPLQRIKAAQVLAELHEQNEKARTQRHATGETAIRESPGTIRIEIDPEAIRASFLGRLAQAGGPGGAAGAADAGRIAPTGSRGA